MVGIIHSWAAAKAAKLAGPKAPGSKIVPEAKTQDCLLGLSFVFTGELSSFSRDEAIDLAKRFGGCVVGLLAFPLADAHMLVLFHKCA